MKLSNSRSALGVAVALATRAYSLATFSPGPSYSVGIPSGSTISSSSTGSIYFQLSAPTSYQWVGLGIGEQMAGATIFVMYADGNGNVTISARDGGQGHVEPTPDSTIQSGVTLLAGSGIVNGKMIANVHCTTCKLLSSSTSTTSPWICAWNIGSALNSASVSTTLNQHTVDSTRQFSFDLTTASLSADSNPFVSSSSTGSSPSGTASGSSPSSTSTGDNSSGGNTGATVVGPSPKALTDYETAHGVIMGAVVVLLFPLGAIFMRLGASAWAHGAWQVFALVAMLCGFGLGIKLAQMRSLLYANIGRTHTIFGTIIVCLFLLQPFLGLFHHLQYRRTGSRSPISYAHIWYGRALMVCGVVNGGLGCKLAGNSMGGKIGYIVVSAVMGVLYIVVVVVRRKGKVVGGQRSGRGSGMAMRRREKVNVVESSSG